MAIRAGKCTNFRNCEAADTRRIFELPAVAPFVCPQCQRELQEIPRKKGSMAAMGKLATVVITLLLLGGASYGVWILYQNYGGSLFGGAAPHGPLLRLHGSNTIGASLAPALAEAFLKEEGATDVRRRATGNDELVVEGVLPGDRSPHGIEIHAHGSATAFKDLDAGKCDIGMASRKVNAEELKSLARFGDLTSRQSEHVLGLDGIAVIVSSDNRLESLTKAQLKDVFTGVTTEWSALKVAGGTIHPYCRDEKSGTFDTFKALLGVKTDLTCFGKRFDDSRALSESVANDRDGIGFIGLPYIGNARAIGVSDAGVAPLFPTKMTVATEDYVLSRRLYLYSPAQTSNALAGRFVAFAISKRGQDVVESEGFVSQNPAEVQAAAPRAGATPAYLRATAGGRQLPVDIRFRRGGAELDNKASTDIDRWVNFLSDPAFAGQRVVLLGFSDNQGSEAANLHLSSERVHAVIQALEPRGLHIRPEDAIALGSAMPVASNDTPEGRDKNRRVEVWLKK